MLTKIVLFIIGLVAVTAGIYFATKKFGSFVPSSTASTTSTILTLTSPTLAIKPGESQTLGVTLNSQVNFVSAVELKITYDPKMIVVDAITPGPYFPSPLILAPLKISTNSATLIFGNTPSAKVKGVQGNTFLANIIFHAVGAGATTLTTTGSRIASINKTESTYENGGDCIVSINQSPSIISYWKLDETSGSQILDSVGSNNGNAVGATVAPGKFGNDRSFNGQNTYITVPNSLSLNPSILSIALWVKPTSYTYGNFVNKGDNNGYRFRILTNGAVQFLDRGGTNALITGATLPLNTWSHVAVSAGPTGIKIYINGNLVGQNNIMYGSPTTSSPLEIGADRAYGEYFNGQLDDIQIFKSVLTASDIQSLYTTNPSPTPPSLPTVKPATIPVSTPEPINKQGENDRGQ